MARVQISKAPGNNVVKRFVQAKKRVLTSPNRLTDLASANTSRTIKAGPKNSNGPKGGSSKSSVPANRTYLKTNNKGKPSKVARVTQAKLNTTKVTPFNKSTRVNYRQLRSK